MQSWVSVWRRALVVLALGLLWPMGVAVAASKIDVPTCIAPAAAIGPDPDIRRLLREPGRFDCHIEQAALGSGNFWVLSAPLPNMGGSSPLTLRTASLWQARTTLYVLGADGRITRESADSRGLTSHINLGAMADWQLPAKAAPARFLWHIEGSANLRGVVVGAQLLTESAVDRSNLRYAGLYAAFGGLCVALLVYNLALWGATRHRFQVAYCLMLLTLGSYALSSSGALSWLWPAIDNNDRLRFNYLALALGGLTALDFGRSYFEEQVFQGWLRRTSGAVAILMTFSTAGVVLLAPWQYWLFDRCYMASFAGLMLVAPLAAWRAWQVRSAYLRLFALSWSAPILLGMVRLASGMGWIRWSVLVDNSTLLAMVLEALLTSLAIAYRVRLLSNERDEALAHEIAARLLADSDPLTSLLNRRAFLKSAIGRPGEQVLLILDIDHFKRVNDTIGHDGGDEVLRVFARSLKAALPADALVARLGGEEFAVVLAPEQVARADALIDAIRATRMPFDLTVTASMGSCIGPLATEADWKMLYRAADRALFEAKAAGRDRIRRAAPQSAA